ncbi:hypothetical protein KFU94_51115 [Chloroflexi bacterium TSY]|nr:hypothetical protein [Chloroflexi bacterium TSY]
MIPQWNLDIRTHLAPICPWLNAPSPTEEGPKQVAGRQEPSAKLCARIESSHDDTGPFGTTGLGKLSGTSEESSMARK